MYRSTTPFTDPANAEVIHDGLVTATSYRDSDVELDTRYYYRIRSVDEKGTEGMVSNAAIAERPLTTVRRTVDGNGLVTFAGTGVSICFYGTDGSSGTVDVNAFGGEPAHASAISEENVSDSRTTIAVEEGLRFDSSRVKMAVQFYDGIEDPSNVIIYKREQPDTGTFEALETKLDNNGTPEDITDDTLQATTTSFSEFVLASNSEPLPVELAGIEAEMGDAEVHLQWQTASETNNAGFRVQRRVRGEANEDETSWTQVGRVEGAGTTTQAQSYRFTDEALPYQADALTYRLEQVDTDGRTSYSDEISVRRSIEGVQLLGTFPNPASQQATVRYALPERQEVTLRLHDAL